MIAMLVLGFVIGFCVALGLVLAAIKHAANEEMGR